MMEVGSQVTVFVVQSWGISRLGVQPQEGTGTCAMLPRIDSLPWDELWRLRCRLLGAKLSHRGV